MSKYYNIEGDSLIKKFNECPQCGNGFFLAKHSDRETCGKCGYTKFKDKKAKKGRK